MALKASLKKNGKKKNQANCFANNLKSGHT